MLAHRKGGLTLSGGPDMAPAVGFPPLPLGAGSPVMWCII